jgi:hypothetical protein
MSLINDSAGSESGTEMRRPTSDDKLGSHRLFKFVPKELTAKCRKLIESYHGIYGYAGLPDMLWLSDARDVIECDRELIQIFRKASKSRGAKRANNSFLELATAVVSLEVLVRDFADWGKRFPEAKQEAEKILGEYPLRQRAWLLDLYLYPRLGVRREFAKELAPSEADPPPSTKN